MCNVKGHIQSCIDTNLNNYHHSSQSHHAKLRLLTISLKSCRRLFLLWRHNFETWPDLTIFFSPKVAQRMPHKLWKISARFSKRCGVQLRKSHEGLHQSPLTGRGLKVEASLYIIIYYILRPKARLRHLIMSSWKFKIPFTITPLRVFDTHANRLVNDSDLNRKMNQNQMIFAWIMNWIESHNS